MAFEWTIYSHTRENVRIVVITMMAFASRRRWIPRARHVRVNLLLLHHHSNAIIVITVCTASSSTFLEGFDTNAVVIATVGGNKRLVLFLILIRSTTTNVGTPKTIARISTSGGGCCGNRGGRRWLTLFSWLWRILPILGRSRLSGGCSRTCGWWWWKRFGTIQKVATVFIHQWTRPIW